MRNWKQNKKLQKIAQNSGSYEELNRKVGGAYKSMLSSRQNLCICYGELDFEKISTKFFRSNEWIFLLSLLWLKNQLENKTTIVIYCLLFALFYLSRVSLLFWFVFEIQSEDVFWVVFLRCFYQFPEISFDILLQLIFGILFQFLKNHIL